MTKRIKLTNDINALRDYFIRNPGKLDNSSLMVARDLLRDYDRLRKGMSDLIVELDADHRRMSIEQVFTPRMLADEVAHLLWEEDV